MLLKQKKEALTIKDSVERQAKLKEVYESLQGLLRGSGRNEKETS